MAFIIGENMGPYRIVEQLGQGGMATVYKAYHAALDRYVALKVMHAAFHEDQTFTERFQREARVVARLEHPHIVPIYDYSEHEARPYLVMKYIEGDTLKTRLHQGPLTTSEIEQVVDSVGSALAYAHLHGILHRDIKPSNVLIASEGSIYLADFGLARIASTGESTLSSDSIMGTPQYISPEQAMGKKNLDAGTDIYSFAVMLYEMVVGQVPFSADTPFSIIHDHIYTPLPLPIDVNPHVPEPVQRVLLKALTKKREDRYATVEEMTAAFKEAWRAAGVPMRGTLITMKSATLRAVATSDQKKRAVDHESRTIAVSKPARKRLSWMWYGVGGVAFLCVAVVFLALINRPANPTREPGLEDSLVSVASPPIPPAEIPSFNQEPVPKEVIEASTLVDQNPGDPFAHLKLSLALWDTNDTMSAMEELTQASNLAGPKNREFYTTAANEYKARNAWGPVAAMYMRMVPIIREEKDVEELKIHLNEAVYRASEFKNLPLAGFFKRIDDYDPPLGFIARGRYALYNGTMEDAKLHFSNARKLRPEMYEVFLLEAEIEKHRGNKDAARKIFSSLSSNLNAPEWVRALAEQFLTSMEQ